MEEEHPQIEVRAIQIDDLPALQQLDYAFETDRIYTLRTQNRLMRTGHDLNKGEEGVAFRFELVETRVDPPIYKDYQEHDNTLGDMDAVEGGYVALADGKIAGGILLSVEEWRSVTLIQELVVGRQFRRYGVGSLLLNCASDWARKRDCWAIVLETQNINYPAIQFYLRNGLDVWGINPHFYPPGSAAYEVAIFMGKHLSSTSEL